MTHTGLLSADVSDLDRETGLAIDFSERTEAELEALADHGVISARTQEAALEDAAERQRHLEDVAQREQQDVEQHTNAAEAGGAAGTSATSADGGSGSLLAAGAALAVIGAVAYGRRS